MDNKLPGWHGADKGILTDHNTTAGHNKEDDWIRPGEIGDASYNKHLASPETVYL